MYVSNLALESVLRTTLTDVELGQIEGLIRRAERELALLVGDLAQYDPELVEDTLVDSIREAWLNPQGLRSETDDSYSYTRFAMSSGTPGRFWWPTNLHALFGLPAPGKRLRTIPLGITPGSRGWL